VRQDEEVLRAYLGRNAQAAAGVTVVPLPIVGQ
jgi:hypothetical protein